MHSGQDGQLGTPQLFLIGLNHRTTPLHLREQLAQTDDDVRRALASLALDEAAIISTCNRLEIYGAAQDVALAQAAGLRWLTQLCPLEQIEQHVYGMAGHEAVVHLLRVAAGLDSMILGEAQILGQVQQALALAQAVGSAGPVLSHWFAQAAHTGKRARTETEISRHVTSISHAAVALAQTRVQMPQARALVVGSGEMAQLAAQALHRHEVRTIQVINRTYARAAALAQQFAGAALDWEYLPQALAAADVVICATGAPHSVIHRRDVEQALAGRGHGPLVLIDIAVPRDVDAGVRALPGVHYYDLDDLNAFVQANMARREAAMVDVERIVSEEAARFMDWYRGRSVTPVITALREKAEALAQTEVETALRRLGDLDAGQQRVVELMAHRIVNRLLHEPTVRLKAAATASYEDVVRDLFALDGDI